MLVFSEHLRYFVVYFLRNKVKKKKERDTQRNAHSCISTRDKLIKISFITNGTTYINEGDTNV